MNSRAVVAVLAGVIVMGFVCLAGIGGLFIVARSGMLPQSQASQVQDVQDKGNDSATTTLAEPVSREPIPLPADAVAIVRAEEEVLAAVYDNVAPGVVNIRISGVENSLLGETGEGSGFVWDADGHIVTNNHVVEGAESIVVTFADSTQAVAEIVGTNEDADLAVIKVNLAPELLHPVPVGDSTTLRVGQRVIAIGNPFGFDNTLTMGVISAIGRTVPGRLTDVGSFSIPNLVQTDAAINPGNSGGPLLDIEGKVIGVNTLIYSNTPNANSGIGFAIPSSKVASVVPDLIATGTYETPYLGLYSPRDLSLTPELAEQLELEGVTYGILVEAVAQGGPSEAAGVRASDREITLPGALGPIQTGGDVIIAIDGNTVQEFDDLINYLDTRRVGDVVTLTVIRDGASLDIPVTLGSRG